jgi:hypothetical protein
MSWSTSQAPAECMQTQRRMKRAQFQQLENEFLKSQARNDNRAATQ